MACWMLQRAMSPGATPQMVTWALRR